MAVQPAGTVTLLFTDVEGSTRLLQEVGRERYANALDLHARLLRQAFEEHDGYEVDCEGDSFFVAFPRAENAVAAAVKVQQALEDSEWPGTGPLRVRMGIHTGEPMTVPPKYVGIDVHRAARIMAAGHGGQVLLSQATRDLLDERFELRDLGEHRLKDLSEPQRLFQLGARDFPALKTLFRSSLPVQPNALIGRERELVDVKQLVRDGARLITLTGPGGTGKTRLALQLAAELADEFPDGAHFVALAPIRNAHLVVPAIAETLGVQEQAGEPLLQRLSEHLRERRALLLLDNFEHVVDAAPKVATLLTAASRVTVLATSRSPLRLSAEQTYPVPPLTVPDLTRATPVSELVETEAVSLFLERARATRPGRELSTEDATAIAAVCVRLDGLPLAIELAAARTRVLSPQALLSRLDERLKLLTGGARDVDERQRTLRATIDWSFELLTPPEQDLFARLAVFVGGCRVEGAEAVSDPASVPDAFESLDSLVENNLVRQRDDPDGEPRFWMLQTIREYALEALRDGGASEEVQRRYAHHLLAVAERVELASRTQEWSALFEQLDADGANLRATVEWALTQQEVDLALRLATALWGYWVARGQISEGKRWLEKSLSRANVPPPRALVGLCVLRHMSGDDSSDVLGDAWNALRACDEASDDFGATQGWNLIARVEGSGLGHVADGEQAWWNALEFAERGGYPAEKAESMGWLMVMSIFGPLPTDQGIERCRRFYTEAGADGHVRAFAQTSRAVLEAMRGNAELARSLLADGHAAFQALGLNVWAANNGQEAFFVEMLAGNPQGAVDTLRASYDKLDQMGERGFLSTIAGMLGHALHALGDDNEAELYSRRSEDAAASDDVYSQVLWRTALAKVLAARGNIANAEALAQAAVDLISPTEQLNTQADAFLDLAEVLRARGDATGASRAVRQAISRYEQKGNLVSLEHARRLLTTA